MKQGSWIKKDTHKKYIQTTTLGRDEVVIKYYQLKANEQGSGKSVLYLCINKERLVAMYLFVPWSEELGISERYSKDANIRSRELGLRRPTAQVQALIFVRVYMKDEVVPEQEKDW